MQDVSEERAYQRYLKLLEMGLIQIHPEDVDKPWWDQRITNTELGEEMALDIEDHLRNA